MLINTTLSRAPISSRPWEALEPISQQQVHSLGCQFWQSARANHGGSVWQDLDTSQSSAGNCWPGQLVVVVVVELISHLIGLLERPYWAAEAIIRLAAPIWTLRKHFSPLSSCRSISKGAAVSGSGIALIRTPTQASSHKYIYIYIYKWPPTDWSRD